MGIFTFNCIMTLPLPPFDNTELDTFLFYLVKVAFFRNFRFNKSSILIMRFLSIITPASYLKVPSFLRRISRLSPVAIQWGGEIALGHFAWILCSISKSLELISKPTKKGPIFSEITRAYYLIRVQFYDSL